MQIQHLQTLSRRELVQLLEFNTNGVIRLLCTRLTDAGDEIDEQGAELQSLRDLNETETNKLERILEIVES